MKSTRNDARRKKHLKIRKKIFGTPNVPRLCVFKSNKNIEVQAIDDVAKKTLCFVSSISLKLANGSNIAAAEKVGQNMGLKLKEKGIKQVVFDRGGYIFFGRVKAMLESVKKEGVKC